LTFRVIIENSAVILVLLLFLHFLIISRCLFFLYLSTDIYSFPYVHGCIYLSLLDIVLLYVSSAVYSHQILGKDSKNIHW
jgi:hypothetical protein